MKRIVVIVVLMVVSGLMGCSGSSALEARAPGGDAASQADVAPGVDAASLPDVAPGVDVPPMPAAGAVGATCNANSDCNSSLCLANRHCSRTCAGAGDCIAGWSCSPLPGVGNLCQCNISEEDCDGQDNDCDGVIDDGAICNGGLICRAGACTCDRTCGSGCVDLATSVTNCGACGRVCPAPTGGTATCSGGACTQSCPGGTTLCGSACVALETDARNCGACGRACAIGQTCSAGMCVASCPANMAYIPAGSFLMGDADTLSNMAQPPHMVTLSAYCMDLTEVTVAAYSRCMAVGCGGMDNYPIIDVTWDQARAYCQRRGGDLPTEAQWEYAARGSDGRIYPWGNAAPASQLCWRGAGGISARCPVRSYPGGNSPFGLFDMAGNAEEWTRDFANSYTSDPAVDPTGPARGFFRVLRGGRLGTEDAALVRSASRRFDNPSIVGSGSSPGFRCAQRAR